MPEENDNGNGVDSNVLSSINSILPSAGNLISELGSLDDIDSIGDFGGVLNNLGGILSNLDAPIEAVQYLNTISNLLKDVDELPELLSNIDGPEDISNLFNQVGSLLGNIPGTEEIVNYLSGISNIIGQIDGLVELFDDIDSPQDALNAISGLLGTGGGIAREVVGLLGGDDLEIDDDSDDSNDDDLGDDDDNLAQNLQEDDDNDEQDDDDNEDDDGNLAQNFQGDDDNDGGSDDSDDSDGEDIELDDDLLEDTELGALSAPLPQTLDSLLQGDASDEDSDNPFSQTDELEEGDFELGPEGLLDEEEETLDLESALDLEDSLDEEDLSISTDENFEQDSDNPFSQTDELEEGDFELGPEGLLDSESEFSSEDVEEIDDLLEGDSSFGFLGEENSEELEEALKDGAFDDDNEAEEITENQEDEEILLAAANPPSDVVYDIPPDYGIEEIAIVPAIPLIVAGSTVLYAGLAIYGIDIFVQKETGERDILGTLGPSASINEVINKAKEIFNEAKDYFAKAGQATLNQIEALEDDLVESLTKLGGFDWNAAAELFRKIFWPRQQPIPQVETGTRGFGDGDEDSPARKIETVGGEYDSELAPQFFETEIIIDAPSYEQARNIALKTLGEIDPATRVAVPGKFGVGIGKEVGFETVVKGVFKRYRLDYDPVKGPHINVEIGKGTNRAKFAIRFPGTEADVDKILKGQQPK